MTRRWLAVAILALTTLALFLADRKHDEEAVAQGRAHLAQQCLECRQSRKEAVDNGEREILECETWCSEVQP